MTTKLIPIACLMLLACTGCMMPNRAAQTARNEERIASEGITKLETGDTAPAISATTANGTFDLSEVLGEGQRVVLFFFPAIDTPNSTRELQQYCRDAESLAAQQITFFGLTKADAAELADFTERYGISIELAADPQLEVAQAYGCALPAGKYLQRTTIGINPDGSIAFYKRHQLTAKEITQGFGLE